MSSVLRMDPKITHLYGAHIRDSYCGLKTSRSAKICFLPHGKILVKKNKNKVKSFPVSLTVHHSPPPPDSARNATPTRTHQYLIIGRQKITSKYPMFTSPNPRKKKLTFGTRSSPQPPPLPRSPSAVPSQQISPILVSALASQPTNQILPSFPYCPL